jgi:hypothetical protein
MSYTTNLFKITGEPRLIRNFSPPQSLFKYHNINDHLNKLLEKKEFHLCHQSKLNDLYEGRFILAESYMEKLISRGGEQMFEYVQKNYPSKPVARLPKEFWLTIGKQVTGVPKWLETFYKDMLFRDMGWGICSFCEENNNDVMWGNYADSFRGVCLEFDFRNSNLANKLAPVTYVN